MPSLEENKRLWNGVYDWRNGGEEWSSAWGGSEFQWCLTVLPRIQCHLPAGTILEIGCGFGRWTRFLRHHCEKIVGVDLSPRCVEACAERFAGDTGARFVLTDGRHFTDVPKHSVDFVFSFDSLVHADQAVLQSYLEEIARVLTPRGGAFIHHSNLGEYRTTLEKVRGVQGLEEELVALGLWDSHLHLRDPGPSAEWFRQEARRHRLHCVIQEKVPWGLEHLFTDCFSTLVPADSPCAAPTRVVNHTTFAQEIELARRLSELYSCPKATSHSSNSDLPVKGKTPGT